MVNMNFAARLLYGIFRNFPLTLASLLFATKVMAAGMLYTGDGFNDGNNALTFGVEFIPSVDITVSALGVFDAGSDGPGLQTSHAAGLYVNPCGSPCTPLVTATVSGTATLQNGFRFVPVSPVVLTAGQSYVIAAYYPSGFAGDKLVSTILNKHPLITVSDQSRLAGGASLVFPNLTNPDFRLSANMLFTANTVVTGNGDLNGDSLVDTADVLLGSRMVNGLVAPTSAQLATGDIAPYSGSETQPDNEFLLNDLLLIIRIASGMLIL
jgi:hypothetical protein